MPAVCRRCVHHVEIPSTGRRLADQLTGGPPSPWSGADAGIKNATSGQLTSPARTSPARTTGRDTGLPGAGPCHGVVAAVVGQVAALAGCEEVRRVAVFGHVIAVGRGQHDQ